MGKVVNFHLPADDVERAATFYRDVFGWEFSAFAGSSVPYLVHTNVEGGAGIPAAITARQDVVKAPTPTIEVENIDDALIQVAMKGGQQGRVQDIAGLGRFGYAIDSEGNVIALLQRVLTPGG
ncbi:MAG: Glyoxalase [Candidatus Eremiobacteraeota bacterium]|nr:Glyoxalase [Candidatus Eremiobacteraeota bacterium]